MDDNGLSDKDNFSFALKGLDLPLFGKVIAVGLKSEYGITSCYLSADELKALITFHDKEKTYELREIQEKIPAVRNVQLIGRKEPGRMINKNKDAGNDKIKEVSQDSNEDHRKIEPKILPLVDALNATRLVETFSSCQGHYKGSDQLLIDRNFADVRFRTASDTDEKELEIFLNYIGCEFDKKGLGVVLDAYKKYVTGQMSISEDFYLITISPKDRFDHPGKKRKDTDEGIMKAVELVKEATAEKKGKRGYLIDPSQRNVQEIFISAKNYQMQEEFKRLTEHNQLVTLDFGIGARDFDWFITDADQMKRIMAFDDAAVLTGEQFNAPWAMYLDANGISDKNNSAFSINGLTGPFFGKALIVGKIEAKDDIDCCFTLNEVEGMVTFYDPAKTFEARSVLESSFSNIICRME